MSIADATHAGCPRPDEATLEKYHATTPTVPGAGISQAHSSPSCGRWRRRRIKISDGRHRRRTYRRAPGPIRRSPNAAQFLTLPCRTRQAQGGRQHLAGGADFAAVAQNGERRDRPIPDLSRRQARPARARPMPPSPPAAAPSSGRCRPRSAGRSPRSSTSSPASRPSGRGQGADRQDGLPRAGHPTSSSRPPTSSTTRSPAAPSWTRRPTRSG